MFNVVQHSGEEGGVFALEADKRLVVARVEDGGVGIHHNMSQAHPGLSEPETLIKALERGGTSTRIRNAGVWPVLGSGIHRGNRWRFTSFSLRARSRVWR